MIYPILVFMTAYLLFLVNLILAWRHILSVLIYLELMALTLFFLLSVMWLNNNELFSPLIYLSVSACESILGISVMILVTKKYGSDLVSIQSVSLW